MKKVAFILAIVMVLSMPLSVSAESRTGYANAILTFDGNKAVCQAVAYDFDDSVYIEVTMRLIRNGGYVEATWTAAGYGSVTLEERKSVVKGRTYDLVVTAKFDGVIRPSVSDTGTC